MMSTSSPNIHDLHDGDLLERKLPQWYLIAIMVIGLLGVNILPLFARYIFAEPFSATAQNIIRSTWVLVILFYAAGIVRVFFVGEKKTWFREKSLFPIYVFVFLAAARYFYEAGIGEIPNPSGLPTDIYRAFFKLAVCFFPIFFFSHQLSDSTKINGGKWCFRIAVAISVFLFIYWFDHFSAGRTNKSLVFLQEECNTTLGVSGTAISFLGFTVGVMSFWYWGQRQLSIVAFLPLYAISILLVFFGMSRHQYLCLVVTELVLLFFLTGKKRLSFWCVIAMMIAINIVGIFFVGSGSEHEDRMFKKRITVIAKELGTVSTYLKHVENEEIASATSTTPDTSATPAASTEMVEGATQSDITSEKNTENTESGEQENTFADPPKSESPGDNDTIQNEPKKQPPKPTEKEMIRVGTGRFVVWKDCLARIREAPFFGYGLSPYKNSGPDVPKALGKGVTPHNEIIEAFLVTGVFGGILFVVIILIGIRDAYVCFRKTPYFAWIGLFFVNGLIGAMLGQTIFFHPAFWLTLVALRANATHIRNMLAIAEQNATLPPEEIPAPENRTKES